ncbi:MAG: hypothetical protein GW795_06380 [Cyanobacteria bacterium]|nr:hypothetical protein [Cyanobacteria bacterium CG_2015-16_32_12]NCO77935.1 hypothetical protein [Cyanobacteria bacterium CG_2015-22_32_23]NCQ05515.1 hypothetical protein [Cyanobacteria bacterium CG_2015-09_32_10]NCQ41512.1 hypothetical protein [Cyanobacteria bacterium CG_2015-04_32_10]NCS83939.1 hypothetical protein [Cyanobacteria bacterium CG_2015-02_32_10]
MEDQLREEYDLKTLKVRKIGAKRQKFGDNIIKLDSDVAEVFSNAESVNEALRFLIRITKENKDQVIF